MPPCSAPGGGMTRRYAAERSPIGVGLILSASKVMSRSAVTGRASSRRSATREVTVDQLAGGVRGEPSRSVSQPHIQRRGLRRAGHQPRLLRATVRDRLLLPTRARLLAARDRARAASGRCVRADRIGGLRSRDRADRSAGSDARRTDARRRRVRRPDRGGPFDELHRARAWR
jgi:hypothetical protein